MYLAFIILLLALAIHHTEKERAAAGKIELSRRARLHLLINNLRSECLSGRLDQADNTMMDIRQEWPTQLEFKQNALDYFPPDSLHKLDSLVKQLPIAYKNKRTIQRLLLEIKYVDEKLDRIPE